MGPHVGPHGSGHPVIANGFHSAPVLFSVAKSILLLVSNTFIKGEDWKREKRSLTVNKEQSSQHRIQDAPTQAGSDSARTCRGRAELLLENPLLCPTAHGGPISPPLLPLEPPPTGHKAAAGPTDPPPEAPGPGRQPRSVAERGGGGLEGGAWQQRGDEVDQLVLLGGDIVALTSLSLQVICLFSPFDATENRWQQPVCEPSLQSVAVGAQGVVLPRVGASAFEKQTSA